MSSRTRSALFLFALLLAPLRASAQNELFREDFEAGLGAWTTTAQWQLQSASEPCSQIHLPFPSGTNCAWFGTESSCNFESTPWDGFLTLAGDIPLPSDAGSIALRFRSWSEGEDDGVWDLRRTWISTNGGTSWTVLGLTYSNSAVLGSAGTPARWITQTYDLTAWAGQSVRLRFEFWAGDWWANWFMGWFLDDIVVESIDGPAIPFCFGDGTYGHCPCGNYGATGRGCAASFDSGGLLEGSGIASLTSDTLLLTGTHVGFSTSFFSQGALQANFGVGAPFGDGLRCTQGLTIRLGHMIAAGGVATYPNPGDDPISIRGGIAAPGTTRVYQVRYRNATPFCTSATYNTTNGLLVTWVP
jgi:hypothetical protein